MTTAKKGLGQVKYYCSPYRVKIYFMVMACIVLFTKTYAAPGIASEGSESISDKSVAALSESELDDIIVHIAQEAQALHCDTKLPDIFTTTYQQVRDGHAISRDARIVALYAVVQWLAEQYSIIRQQQESSQAITDTLSDIQSAMPQRAPRQSSFMQDMPSLQNIERAPRPDAPNPDSPTSTTPVVPAGCDLTAVTRLLGVIRSRIGTTTDSSCQETVLGILGDACLILGTNATVSSALKDLIVSTSLTNENFCSPTFIRQSDIGTGNPGYTIGTAGVYKAAENLTYSPAAGSQQAIRITVSDVILDLQCYTLQQGNVQAGTDAVRINSFLNDVTIKNGTVKNFTRAGISTQANSSRITVDDVLTLSCDVRGIEFLSTNSDNAINNVRVFNCNRGASGDYGIFLQNSFRGTVNKCTLNNNGLSSHALSAVRLESCGECSVKDTEINTNIGSSLIGVDINTTNSSSVTRCLVRNNSALVTTCTAYAFAGASQCYNAITDCTAQENSATTTCFGFDLAASTTANLFVNCAALGNHGNSVTGYLLTGPRAHNNVFIDCLSLNNQALGTLGIVSGFAIENGADFGALLRCISSFNTSSNYIAQGLVLQNGTGGNNWSIRDGEYERNIGSSNANSFGIRLITGSSNLFSRNRSFNNGTTAANQLSGLAAGSTFDRNTDNMTGATGPWGNVGIIPA